MLAKVELKGASGQVALLAAAAQENAHVMEVLRAGGLDFTTETSRRTLQQARQRQAVYRLRGRRVAFFLEDSRRALRLRETTHEARTAGAY